MRPMKNGIVVQLRIIEMICYSVTDRWGMHYLFLHRLANATVTAAYDVQSGLHAFDLLSGSVVVALGGQAVGETLADASGCVEVHVVGVGTVAYLPGQLVVGVAVVNEGEDAEVLLDIRGTVLQRALVAVVVAVPFDDIAPDGIDAAADVEVGLVTTVASLRTFRDKTTLHQHHGDAGRILCQVTLRAFARDGDVQLVVLFIGLDVYLQTHKGGLQQFLHHIVAQFV